MKIAYIEWKDSLVVSGGMSEGAAIKEEPTLMKTAGMLIREDEEVVSVAKDIYEWTDGEGEKHTTARELEVIPRIMVRRLEIIEVLPDSLCRVVPPPPPPIFTTDGVVYTGAPGLE